MTVATAPQLQLLTYSTALQQGTRTGAGLGKASDPTHEVSVEPPHAVFKANVSCPRHGGTQDFLQL